jgi:hypothetical protein
LLISRLDDGYEAVDADAAIGEQIREERPLPHRVVLRPRSSHHGLPQVRQSRLQVANVGLVAVTSKVVPEHPHAQKDEPEQLDARFGAVVHSNGLRKLGACYVRRIASENYERAGRRPPPVPRLRWQGASAAAAIIPSRRATVDPLKGRT